MRLFHSDKCHRLTSKHEASPCCARLCRSVPPVPDL